MRTPTDYAIEFGEYLAQSAESLLALHAADPMELTEDDWTDTLKGLRSSIYEFRKRAVKAAAKNELVVCSRIGCTVLIPKNEYACPPHMSELEEAMDRERTRIQSQLDDK